MVRTSGAVFIAGLHLARLPPWCSFAVDRQRSPYAATVTSSLAAALAWCRPRGRSPSWTPDLVPTDPAARC